MSRRVALLLLGVAAHRWPAELRDDLRREWAAELHTLASRRQHARMLRFAASLAARRSGGEATDRAPLGRRVSRAAPLLLAPAAGVALVVALVLMSTVVGQLSWHVAWAYDLQLPLLTVLVGGGAAGLAVAADRLARRVPSGGWRVAAGVVVAPLALTALIVGYALRHDADELPAGAPALVAWLAGLALVLRAVGALAGTGRVRAAWAVGLLGAFAVADLAVVLAVLNAVPTGPDTILDGVPQGDTVDPVSAPLWLLISWTDSALGLPRPTGPEVFRITDVVVPLPHFYLAVTPYALAWTVRATRARPATAPTLAVESR